MVDFTDPAQYYLDNGFNPIPTREDKSPMLPAGNNFLYQPMTAIDVDNYFPKAKGVGIAAGNVSDGIECIDFDAHGGENISEIFETFISEPTINHMIGEGFITTIKTPNGYHAIIKSDAPGSPDTLARWKDGNVMIEVRANGSYFVTIPTPGYHKLSGVELIKLNKCEQEERNFIFDYCKSLTRKEIEQKEASKRKWPETWDNDSIFGHFNNNGERFVSEALEQSGWTHVRDRDYKEKTVQYWRRPGKQKGISATFGQYNNMFYCFSGDKDALPFQERTGYTPVDVVLKLRFKDNFNEFKTWLNELYKVKVPEKKQEYNNIRFPVDIFPPVLKEFIEQMNETLNYNKDFLSIAALFNFSVINGNKFKLKVKNGWIAPSIFWTIALGEPGTMKTHPLQSIIKPLQRIDIDNKKQFEKDIEHWEIYNEDAKKSEREPKPHFQQMLVNDYTLEALHEVHNHNKNGIGLYKDEIVGFLHDMNKYRKGSDEQFWLESFNNGSYVINRVSKKPMLIEHININIIGSIQPEVLARVIKDKDGSGLIDRFLFTVAETEIKHIGLNDIDEGWFNWWEQIIRNASAQFKDHEPTVKLMTDEAKKEFQRIDQYIVKIQKSDDETTGMKNYVSKIKTYVPRFALITWIIDCIIDDYQDDQIGLIHMEKAWKICQYFINSARFIFGESVVKREISEVARSMTGKSNVEKIIALHKKEFKQKDIAAECKVSTAYVSKVIKENQLKLT